MVKIHLQNGKTVLAVDKFTDFDQRLAFAWVIVTKRDGEKRVEIRTSTITRVEEM